MLGGCILYSCVAMSFLAFRRNLNLENFSSVQISKLEMNILSPKKGYCHAIHYPGVCHLLWEVELFSSLGLDLFYVQASTHTYHPKSTCFLTIECMFSKLCCNNCNCCFIGLERAKENKVIEIREDWLSNVQLVHFNNKQGRISITSRI